MFISKTKEKITKKGAEKSRYVQEGDFILSNSMSFGHPYILKIDGYIHDGWLALRNINPSLNKEFLYYLLSSENIFNQFSRLATGGVVNNLNSNLVRGVSIPLPSLEVQREIVAEVEGYQKVIDGARQVVDNWKPQIEVDPEWPMVKLGEVCEINSESAEPKELFGKSDFAYIDITSVENGTGKVSFSNSISTKDAPSRARRIVRNDDILISTVRPNLKAFAILNNLPEKSIASTGFAVLRSKKSVIPLYLYTVFFSDFVIGQMIAKMGKGAYPSINSSDVENISIYLPPVNMQREIVVKIEAERKVVDGCRELVIVYEEKIRKVMDEVWAE
jgi:restriction endonuclease S subunit